MSAWLALGTAAAPLGSDWRQPDGVGLRQRRPLRGARRSAQGAGAGGVLTTVRPAPVRLPGQWPALHLPYAAAGVRKRVAG